jgi:endonuclease/exonuclease/phosphatase family metal-dependent hydrolase
LPNPNAPEITDPVPEQLATEFEELCVALKQIPSKQLDQNLLIATWNIRVFGGLTKKWESMANDTPKRDLYSLRCIAEIVSRFDIVAIQEVVGNLRALRHMLKALNSADPHWGLLLTDVNRGKRGHNERMAFVFDTRRVDLSGLACEIVIPEEGYNVDEGLFLKQFARSPYAVSFKSSGKTFVLITVHIFYSEEVQRSAEVRAIAKWLADWAKQVNSWDHNLITLGDFNIDREGDELYEELIASGLQVPEELLNLPRSIFGSPSKEKFYDQIAWFTGEGGNPILSLRYTGKGGIFDFRDKVLQDLTLFKKSYRISDHFPLWVEFALT